MVGVLDLDLICLPLRRLVERRFFDEDIVFLDFTFRSCLRLRTLFLLVVFFLPFLLIRLRFVLRIAAAAFLAEERVYRL